ncbi:unnamed protein product [Protopolystoma xenopodis]|uniref:G-protein coupled receptors family 1 profile domain-containing protein n=1 Tax=Protopolystoma xenopodis TaxID=117903 RepID=A0A3S4ZVY0_9PLAT|nr:unnamed protein product [Protopolystoma xenopodis]
MYLGRSFIGGTVWWERMVQDIPIRPENTSFSTVHLAKLIPDILSMPSSNRVASEAWYWVTVFLPTICHTASTWLNVALAGQRLIYITWPTQARQWTSVRCSQLVGLFAFLAAFLLHWPIATVRFVSYAPVVLLQPMDTVNTSSVDIITNSPTSISDSSANVFYLEPSNQTSNFCDSVQMAWPNVLGLSKQKNNNLPQTVIMKCHLTNRQGMYIYFWFRVMCHNVLPCILLILLTGFLIAGMQRISRRRKRLFASPRPSSIFPEVVRNEANHLSPVSSKVKESHMCVTTEPPNPLNGPLDTENKPSLTHQHRCFKSLLSDCHPRNFSCCLFRAMYNNKKSTPDLNSAERLLQVPKSTGLCRERIGPKTGGTQSSSGTDPHNTSKLLIVVLVIFLLAQIPTAIVTLGQFVHLVNTHTANPSHQTTTDDRQFYLKSPNDEVFASINQTEASTPFSRLPTVVCNLIILISYKLNFFIYWIMSAQFRQNFYALFFRPSKTRISTTMQHTARFNFKNCFTSIPCCKNTSALAVKKTKRKNETELENLEGTIATCYIGLPRRNILNSSEIIAERNGLLVKFVEGTGRETGKKECTDKCKVEYHFSDISEKLEVENKKKYCSDPQTSGKPTMISVEPTSSNLVIAEGKLAGIGPKAETSLPFTQNLNQTGDDLQDRIEVTTKCDRMNRLHRRLCPQESELLGETDVIEENTFDLATRDYPEKSHALAFNMPSTSI